MMGKMSKVNTFLSFPAVAEGRGAAGVCERVDVRVVDRVDLRMCGMVSADV